MFVMLANLFHKNFVKYLREIMRSLLGVKY